MEKISHSIYVDDIASGDNDEGHNSKMVLKGWRFQFVTNSSDLQKKIDENERLLQLPPTDHSLNDEEESESYTKFTLGTTQKVHTGEVKILGVKWNSLTDSFIFDFSDVVSIFNPPRGMQASSMILLDLSHLLLYVLRSYSKRCVKPRLTGMMYFLQNCNTNGNPWYPVYKSVVPSVFQDAILMVSR